MITEELREGAQAIIEHAKNLSGGGTARNGADGASVFTPSPAAQFPSESGHWYCPKTGNQVELPPRTWTATALKQGYVPGVTTITKVAHKEAIQRWMVNRAIKFAADVLRDCNEYTFPEDDPLISQVWQLLNADSDAITGRGKELHGAIEQFATRYESFDRKWEEHISNVANELAHNSVDLLTGNLEHSFATSRYGGKIDWHNGEWLLDFKTKPRIEDGKKLAYPEHAQQLAAYDNGIGYKVTIYRKPVRRCANVFIGVEDAKVVFHEWNEKDLLKGWRKFECLLNTWWCDYDNH